MHDGLYAAARSLLRLDPEVRRSVVRRLMPGDAAVLEHALRHDWKGTWARRKQLLPEGSWRWLLLLAGRNFGKTLAGSQAIREAAESGEHEWLSIVGPTHANLVRDQLTGPSGVLTISPRWFRPEYLTNRAELRWPRHPLTGVVTRASLLSADRPDRIRGSQASFLWCDEVSAWPKAQAAFEMVDMTLRLGPHPRGLLTTTPKSSAFTRDLVLGARGDDGKRRGPRPDLRIVRGTTWENFTTSAATVASLRERYEGTTLGRQELEAEILTAPESALWTRETIDQFRTVGLPPTVRVVRRIVSVDPSRSAHGTRDACGIISLVLAADGHVYVLADDTVRGGPLKWAQTAASAAKRIAADQIIFEQNRLSEDIGNVLRQVAGWSGTNWKAITAQGTKTMRAEPAAALYAAGRVHHTDAFDQLEEELCSWDPDASAGSPDRMDALVNGVTELVQGISTRAPLIVRS